MYYLAYNKFSNRLVDLSTNEIPPGNLIIVETREGDIPDLTRWVWSSSTLDWSPRDSSRVIGPLDLMRRFTDAELSGLYTAAKTNVMVEVWLERFKVAADINLDDPLAVAGMQALEAAGIIGVGRAAEILG